MQPTSECSNRKGKLQNFNIHEWIGTFKTYIYNTLWCDTVSTHTIHPRMKPQKFIQLLLLSVWKTFIKSKRYSTIELNEVKALT